jgi:formate hydrogenlyase subunit 6/NADH:ubiquinone oxidoreductase subunit I
MSAVAIDARCTACGQCIATCPERALIRAPKRPVVLIDQCTVCYACIEICPVDAISEIAEVEH